MLDSSPAPLFDFVVQLELESVLRDYTNSRRRLLVLGYNATLTTAVEAPRQPKRHFDQIQVSCLPNHQHMCSVLLVWLKLVGILTGFRALFLSAFPGKFGSLTRAGLVRCLEWDVGKVVHKS